MSVRILENREQGMAVLYDSVTDVAFGPVFFNWSSDKHGDFQYADDVAEAFLDWLEVDPRKLTPLEIADAAARFSVEIERFGWDALVNKEVAS
jgi:hypothetical protein